MKMKIAPSILAADYMHFGDQIRVLDEEKADMIHFDVMDGKFVQEITFGEGILRQIRKITDCPLDVHLMIVDPMKNIASFAKAGADRITVHYEACENVKDAIDLIHSFGLGASVSVKPGTPVEVLFPYLEDLEMVLIMTVEPGYGGQAFLPESPERISKVREEINRRGLKVDIQVDGGINASTVQKAAEAGANVFVAGSALFKGDLAGNIRAMREKL